MVKAEARGNWSCRVPAPLTRREAWGAIGAMAKPIDCAIPGSRWQRFPDRAGWVPTGRVETTPPLRLSVRPPVHPLGFTPHVVVPICASARWRLCLLCLASFDCRPESDRGRRTSGSNESIAPASCSLRCSPLLHHPPRHLYIATSPRGCSAPALQKVQASSPLTRLHTCQVPESSSGAWRWSAAFSA